ncbi:hypothetical protein [Pseudoxanthomonas sp.]|uniref:hypothetical protein n=1 Tax=Pseudoxanthomonas sp. TaxID=1871049 RepID=UPI002639521E|nr:hypothetical protein [Pseudoxanthomonas sp.]WDS36087.1 MAG: hypothetical protein O8I58_17655 [Pseudoxanthomonas sp.]
MLLQGRAVRHAARRLPRVLVSCGVRLEQGLVPLLLPLRHGCSGAVVFQLAEATVRALRERPLDLLRNACSPRDPQAPAYRPWRALAVRRGGPVWMAASLQVPAWLLVIPDDGVAVYLWRDGPR